MDEELGYADALAEAALVVKLMQVRPEGHPLEADSPEFKVWAKQRYPGEDREAKELEARISVFTDVLGAITVFGVLAENQGRTLMRKYAAIFFSFCTIVVLVLWARYYFMKTEYQRKHSAKSKGGGEGPEGEGGKEEDNIKEGESEHAAAARLNEEKV